MHSGCGALAETHYVYLHNSGIASALQQQRPQAVLEIGLGTGMAVLATAQLAELTSTPVQYLAIEINPLPSKVIRQLRFEQLGFAQHLIDDLCELLEHASSADQSRRVGACCEVTIQIADAAQWQTAAQGQFDAVYFDPFSPATNPNLWTIDIFRRMHDALRNGGKLVSYCVNRRVRNDLAAAGFDVERVPGPPGGKREVLIAARRPDDVSPGLPND